MVAVVPARPKLMVYVHIHLELFSAEHCGV